MKTYNTREFIKLLQKNGFEYCGCKGDHSKYKRNNDTAIVTKKINKMVAKRMIKEFCLQ